MNPQCGESRPWGGFEVLSDGPDHKVKRITVKPGLRLSLQRHRKRAEHWYVVSGEGVVTIDEGEIRLGPGGSVDIERGAWHRMANCGVIDLVWVEVQTGSYFGEDDIERREDDFGRC